MCFQKRRGKTPSTVLFVMRQPNVVFSVSFATCEEDESWRFWETFDNLPYSISLLCCATIVGFNEVTFTGHGWSLKPAV